MNLDSQQTAAVQTTARRALVLAGAGSGKTRTLIERIAHLIEDCKVSPSEIMAFSFTRKASQELRNRLLERIGNKAYGCHLGTMHGLALQFIHQFGEIIGLRPANVTVYSEWEADFLLQDVAAEMSAKKPTIKACKEALEHYYQTGEEPAEDDPGRDLFMVFLARCRENNALTYGALLIGMGLLIPTMQKYLHVKHILVDEVQDIDHLQWSIILQMEDLLGAAVFLVGDVDQSIYEWRGAAPKYLVDNQEFYTLFRIENNYRSVPSIVNAANRLIQYNLDRIPKTMEATREDGAGRVIVQRDCDSQFIVALFSTDAASSNGVAILARKHALLGKIDRLMEEAKIPHTYIGQTTALTQSEQFRRFHAFLKLAVNPYDNFSFLLVRDIIGVTREDYAAIRLHAAQEGKSHYQVFGDAFSTRYHDAVTSLNPALSFHVSAMAEFFPSLSPESMAFINAYLQDHPDDISQYLDWLALWDLQDEIKEDNKGIVLATIHAAKGLEWPVVIIAGMNEGIIPSRPNDPDEIEAERRLMYVAMTRAKDQLVLTIRPTVTTDPAGRVKTSPESRFVAEAMNGGPAIDPVVTLGMIQSNTGGFDALAGHLAKVREKHHPGLLVGDELQSDDLLY